MFGSVVPAFLFLPPLLPRCVFLFSFRPSAGLKPSLLELYLFKAGPCVFPGPDSVSFGAPLIWSYFARGSVFSRAKFAPVFLRTGRSCFLIKVGSMVLAAPLVAEPLRTAVLLTPLFFPFPSFSQRPRILFFPFGGFNHYAT